MIEVSGLCKSFNVSQKEPGLKGSIKGVFSRKWIEKTALDQVNLRVGAGEILGLVGANGAGKTTLVKILSGIVHPSSGAASVMGFVPWERKNEFRRQVSLIMGQKAQLWWDLPAEDGFLLLKEIYQIEESKFKQTHSYLVETLGVQDQLKTQLRRLSLGERMKMELIAALLHSPRVVFLDEPTIGLDLTAQKAIREFILQYRREHRPAMILTSHYMDDIEKLCERIVILRDGGVVYDGAIRELTDSGPRQKVLEFEFEENHLDCSKLVGELADLASIVSCEGEKLKLRVVRERVSEVAAKVMARYQVRDLAIAEPDLGEMIEKTMRKRGK